EENGCAFARGEDRMTLQAAGERERNAKSGMRKVAYFSLSVFRVPLAILLSMVICGALPAFAALEATDKTWDGSEPPQGIYFHWYEPSFYTGCAPTTQDPTRVHIRLSRGQQV